MQAAGRRWQAAKTARGVHKGHLGKAAPMCRQAINLKLSANCCMVGNTQNSRRDALWASPTAKKGLSHEGFELTPNS